MVPARQAPRKPGTAVQDIHDTRRNLDAATGHDAPCVPGAGGRPGSLGGHSALEMPGTRVAA